MWLLIGAIIVYVLLAGGDPQTADRAGDVLREVTQAVQRNLNKERRETIDRVNAQAGKVFRTHGVKSQQPSAAEVRTSYQNIYLGLAQINVAECPEDFRVQYRRVVISVRELSEAADSVPSDFVELLGYWLTQADTPNPDVFGHGVSRNLKIAAEKVQFELSELDAVTNKYN